MDPVTMGMLASGGMNALSSIMAGRSSAKGAKHANEMNIKFAREQMAWQEMMANTAHQREVRDLRAAGLNPILSATGGMGAATPSGATATMQSEEGAGVASALQALTAATNATLANAQAEKTKAETEQVKTITNTKLPAEVGYISDQAATARALREVHKQDVHLKAMDTRLKFADIDKTHALTDLLKTQNVSEAEKTMLTRMNVATAAEQLKGWRNEGKISDSAYGKFLATLKRLTDTVPLTVSGHLK